MTLERLRADPSTRVEIPERPDLLPDRMCKPLEADPPLRREVLACPGLRPQEKLLLCTMEDVARSTCYFYAFQEHLALWTGLDQSTVYHALSCLRYIGAIACVERGGGRRPNTFRLLWLEAERREGVYGLSNPIQCHGPPVREKGAVETLHTAGSRGAKEKEELPVYCRGCRRWVQGQPLLSAGAPWEKTLLETEGGETTPPPPSICALPVERQTTQEDGTPTATFADVRQTNALAAPSPSQITQGADLEPVLAILAPGGATPKLRAVLANALADAKAAGVMADEIAAALGGVGPGRPWDRIRAAAGAVLQERRSRDAAVAAKKAAEAARTPPPAAEPPSARLPTLAEAIRRLAVAEVFLRDQPQYRATVVSATVDAIVIERPGLHGGAYQSCLRTEADLGRWSFGDADAALGEAAP